MSALRQRMVEDLRVRKLSENTISNYVRRIRLFAEHSKRSPEDLGPEEVRAYMIHLVEDLKLGSSVIYQTGAALRFLYKVTLRCDWDVDLVIPRPKRAKRLPFVLSHQEVAELLNAVANEKHRAMVWTLYSAGLRATELAELRVSDIDSKRMMIRVREGKGDKERFVPLSEVLLEVLRGYWRTYRPKTWLFPQDGEDAPISRRSVHRIVRKAAKVAGIERSVAPHCLRHSYATHLLDAGTNLRVIQCVLGHSSIQSTQRYMHVSMAMLRQAKSPLDSLAVTP